MQTFLDPILARLYSSQSQKIRVLTESWVTLHVFCPHCGEMPVERYPNNRPVADFFCTQCHEEYELKSKKNDFGKKIVDGAYGTMMDRLQSATNPNLFLLSYDRNTLNIKDFVVIPKHFFTADIIEKRNPLSHSAQRAGWVGCNILIQYIPSAGRIFLVKDGRENAKDVVLKEWHKTLFLRDEKQEKSKGWLLDVMLCIEKLGRQEFILSDLYAYEAYLSKKHPDNFHIKDKIRQQLQILRDQKYLIFTKRGCYRLVA